VRAALALDLSAEDERFSGDEEVEESKFANS